MNFSDALNVDAGSIERPPIAPKGHYRLKITGTVFGEMASDKGAWDYVDFKTQALSANDDVDPTDLDKFGGTNLVRPKLRFMFDKGEDNESAAKAQQSLFRMQTFLIEHCGIDGTGLKLRALIDKAKGAEFLGSLTHRQDKVDKELFYSEIDKTAPL